MNGSRLPMMMKCSERILEERTGAETMNAKSLCEPTTPHSMCFK